MRQVVITLPNQLADDLVEVARRRRLKLDTLVRRAVQLLYEDDLDALIVERSLAEYKRNLSGTMSIEEYMRRRFPDVVPAEAE
ncbi:MAG: hypothetical protein EXR52_03695 [Dehalococcoidia bacterium]|nr:hypothetical protein [Dehalococcoidia bacterium]